MTDLPTTSKFVKPRWFDEIQGYGLTSSDLAASLGKAHFYIRRQIKRLDWSRWKTNGWVIFGPRRSKNSGRGRPRIDYILNSVAAEVFIARDESLGGDAYLAFLIRCRIAAPELVKALAEERAAHARTKIALEDALNRTPKALPRPRAGQMDVIVGFVVQPSLFGDNESRTPIIKKTQRQILSERELIRSTMEHIVRILNGLTTRQVELQDELAFIDTPTWNKQHLN